MNTFISTAVEATAPTGVTQDEVALQNDLIQELNDLTIMLTGDSMSQGDIETLQQYSIDFLKQVRLTYVREQ